VAGKYRAAKDVMALASRGSAGGSSRKVQTSTGPRGLSVNQLHSPWEEDDTATHDTVPVLPYGAPGIRKAGAALYHRREAPTGPPLCYICWTCWDSKIVPLSYSHNTGVNGPGKFKLIVQHSH